MISTMRAIANLFVVAAALTPLMLSSPAAAASPPQVAYVSSTGSDSNEPCTTAAQPCATVGTALLYISATMGGVVSCIGGTGPTNDTGGIELLYPFEVTIDCPGGAFLGNGANSFGLELPGANQTLKIRHLTFNLANSASGASAIVVQGSGNLILEDCVFENGSGVALDITPNGAFNLVIRNTRISNSGAGILINPASGGSVKASLDHVTITQNNGGGIKVETTNGPVTLDIANSEITYNSGNGINVVGGAGGQGRASIKTSVISENGGAGVQSNGANSGLLLQTTLLDENAAGATSVVGGGHISTYGNNSIVGSAGSGFTAPAPLQ
jgi:hypothetical protein